MKKEIQSREEVIQLVNFFYEKVNRDELLSPIFNQIAKTNWEKHLPKMYDFWSALLLGENNYSGNPMKIHVDLSIKTNLTHIQFNRWLHLFNETIDEHFIGEKSVEAKTRAKNIARLMLLKINNQNK